MTRSSQSHGQWASKQGGTVTEVRDYYPYGGLMPARSYSNDSPRAKEHFTGKERDREFEFLEFDYFGARFYDANIVRWTSVDPLAEKHPDVSPYAYVLGNPMLFVDPDGRQLIYALAAREHDPNKAFRNGPISSLKSTPALDFVDNLLVGLSPFGALEDAGDIRRGSLLAALGPVGDATRGIRSVGRAAGEAFETVRSALRGAETVGSGERRFGDALENGANLRTMTRRFEGAGSRSRALAYVRDRLGLTGADAPVAQFTGRNASLMRRYGIAEARGENVRWLVYRNPRDPNSFVYIREDLGTAYQQGPHFNFGTGTNPNRLSGHAYFQ